MSSELSTTSKDGTKISFTRDGSGPSLVLVEPAGHYRELSAFDGLLPLLTDDFTVITYDRRGRGKSGDANGYDPVREVEDLAAIVEVLGGSAAVYGYSSGALVALHAAAAGLPISSLALLEPPLELERKKAPDPLTEEVYELVHRDCYEDAVERFHESIGVPRAMIDDMRGTDSWKKMTSIAPTLIYDCRLSEITDRSTLERVDVPTLVLDSEGSSDDLTGSAALLARHLRNARHRSLPGEWHVVAPEVIASELKEHFGLRAPDRPTPASGSSTN